MLNWNLDWTLNNETPEQSTFTVLLGDEPLFNKTMTGTIFSYVGETKKRLTFTETSHEFLFEKFNEFILDLEQGKTTEFIFDEYDGNESFRYSSETEKITFNMEYFTSNMKFELPITKKSRMQFAYIFREFLYYQLIYINEDKNWKNVFVHRCDEEDGDEEEDEEMKEEDEEEEDGDEEEEMKEEDEIKESNLGFTYPQNPIYYILFLASFFYHLRASY